MTGDKVYEKLKVMTPEERARLCYDEPWHVAYLKDLIKRMIEKGEVDPTEARLLLVDEGRLMEILDRSVGCDVVDEDAAFVTEVEMELKNQIRDSIDTIVNKEEK